MKDGDASGIAGVADNHCMKRVTAARRAPLQRPFARRIKFVQNYEKTLAFRFRLCQNASTLSYGEHPNNLIRRNRFMKNAERLLLEIGLRPSRRGFAQPALLS